MDRGRWLYATHGLTFAAQKVHTETSDSGPPESAFAPASLDSDDPRLQQGVDGDGEAIISRWWAVTFIDGAREQQEEAQRTESGPEISSAMGTEWTTRLL
jgi:hypothetical protein